MPTDTRSLFQRPGLPLKVGRSVVTKNNVPGVYQSADSSGRPRTGLTMVQTAQPSNSSSLPQPVLRTGLTPAPRSVYDPNAQIPGSFADSNARVNAGIYAAGTFGADNAVANGTGIAVNPNTPITSPISGMPSAPNAPRAVAPTTVAAQQTESANPLTGDGNQQVQGASAPVDAGAALGFSRKGSSVPSGQDAQPTSNVGGTGLYARTFKSPKSASLYHDYVQRLFSANTGSTTGTVAQN